NTAVVRSWARIVASNERKCSPMNVTRAMATMATATSTSKSVKPAALRSTPQHLACLLLHVIIEDLYPARQWLNHQGGLLVAVGYEVDNAWLSQPRRMKMRRRFTLTRFGPLGRHHVQDMDIRRQDVIAQLPTHLWPTHIALEIAHRHHLP